MLDKYAGFMDDVEKMIKDSGNDPSKKHPFRSRSAHTRRVFRWAERLMEDMDEVDKDVAYMAVVFHDAGYSDGACDEHQVSSERIFREYAAEHGFDKDFTEKVALCVGTHSNKELMTTPEKLTKEQIIVMEADLLDEEGALAIVWNGLACGYKGDTCYEAVLNRTIEKFSHKKGNPMITERGRALWDEKMQYVADFIKRLEIDLEM